MVEDQGKCGAFTLLSLGCMQKKTVKTEDLQSKATYVCVSHTWGRYREKEKPAIKVPGVPWMIPKNSKFEVDTLPEQLLAAFGTGYVWFDLLCIHKTVQSAH